MKLTAKPASGSLSAHKKDGGFGAKLLRVMKLTTIIILTVCLHSSANGLAQQTVTFSGKEVSLENIFNAIKKQTSYRFFFNTNMLQQATRVSIEVKNAPIDQVMTLALKDQPLTYTIKGRTIFIMKKPEEIKSSTNMAPQTGDPITVSGKVTDDKGQPLVGANVKVKGSNNGVVTDNQGRFSLSDVDPNATLEISFVGHETQLLAVKGKSMFSVTLGQKLSVLDETVVIAYGTTTKRFNTGNVSSVKASDIEKQPITNALLSLQGRVPGMEVTQSTGLPGSGVKVHIRGLNSIQNGNDPLYVVDGVPYVSQNMFNLGAILGTSGTSITGSPFSYINPSDIESIEVLKDADATAIYGSRGASGVVLITTKKGKTGKTSVSLNVQNGFGKVARRLNVLNTRQYLDMRYEAFENDGSAPQQWDYDLTLWDTTRNTDWQKELIGGSANYFDVQASVSGGNVNTQFFVGGGYHKETTVFPGSLSNQKGSIHFSLNNLSTNQKFRLMLVGNYLIDNNRLMTLDLTSDAIQLAPNAPELFNSDGSLNWALDENGTSSWVNPLRWTKRKYNSKTINLINNIVLSYYITPQLEIKNNLGFFNIQTDEFTTDPFTSADPSLPSFTRSARFVDNNIQSWLIEPQLNYKIAFQKANVNILIGSTFQQNKSTSQTLNASGFNNDLVIQDIKSAPSISVGGTTDNLYKYAALFARVGLNLHDKYLLNLTARRDGTSRFGPDNRFHSFGSVGLGWIFSEEKFIINTFPFLSFGKLRGSYGSTGSDQVGDYTYLDLYNTIGVGIPYQGITGFQINNLFTPDLAWEETKKLEGAIEFGFFKDRVLLTASYFRNESSNQLTNYTLSSVTGFTSITRNLNAKVQNSGWEFSLNTTNVNNNHFKWRTSINLTSIKNKLVSVAPGMNQNYQRLVGNSLTSTFVYRSLGVDKSSGQYIFDDGYGAPTFSPDTSYSISTYAVNIFPKFYGGIQNSIQYKGIQLEFLFQFVKQIGRNYFIGNYPGQYYGGGNNQPNTVLERWRKPGDVAKIQKFNQDFSIYGTYSYAEQSDLVYSDASYIRLKNVSLSWTFPEKNIKRIGINNCQLFVLGQNILTVTDYIGLDPETMSSNSLPPLRTITMGIKVTL